MKIARWVLIGIGALLVLTILRWAYFHGPFTYRFRMTVEVATPQGVRTGSSVMEVKAGKSWLKIGDVGPGYGDLRGQAVVVDLPDGPVFALLKTEINGADPLDVAVTNTLAGHVIVGNDDYVATVRSIGHAWFTTYRGELERAAIVIYPDGYKATERRWPLFVRFRDINDPMTAERVDPQTIGVRRISVVSTSDPITTGLEKTLPWLLRIRGKYLNGRSTSLHVPLELHGGYFSTEIRP